MTKTTPALVALALAISTALTACSKSPEPASDPELQGVAMQAAMAALEEGKRVLFSTPDWSTLLADDSRQPRPLPGWDSPQSEVRGMPLPGGATATLALLNNDDDPGFSSGRDEDGMLVLSAEARLPNGVSRVLEIKLAKHGQ